MEFSKIDKKEELMIQLNEIKEENVRLQKRCNNYQFFIDNAMQDVWEWDVKNDIYSITDNPNDFYKYNFDIDNFSIQNWKKLIHPEDVDKVVENLKNILDEKQENYESTYRLQTISGDYKWILSKGRVVKDNNRNVIKIKGYHTDITEKIEIERKSYNINYFNSLTTLSNKEQLYKEFGDIVKRQSLDCKAKMAFLYMDIDNLGYINSILGYEEGNKIIIRLSEFLKERYTNHLISRISADEFIVIYRYQNDLSNLKREVEYLLEDLRTKKFIDHTDIRVSISMGVSIYKEHGEEFFDLLKNADVALYCAKKKGKDRFEVYHEHMEQNVFNFVELSNQIKEGMIKEEFSMYYQPIIDTKTEKLVGLEALLRWNHTNKGFISPDSFIPIAEETGIIVVLEKWILKEVFNQVKLWSDKGEGSFFVSINLSAKGLVENNLLEFLDEMIEKNKVCTENIEFEVTETSMLQDVDYSIAMLKKLNERGFKISLDDFGTGYSSLNYFRKLPISKVKIDKSFIQGMEANKDRLLVKTIIDLAHVFGIKVIAEGVEDIEQINLLKTMGCDNLQGYYYGKPAPVSEIEEMFKKIVIIKEG